MSPPPTTPANAFAVIDELDELPGEPSEAQPKPKPVVDPTLVVRVAARTHTGHVRKDNEDAFAVVDVACGEIVIADDEAAPAEIAASGGVMLAVSDGMGGAAAGEVASALVIETLVRQVAAHPEDAADALRRAVDEANDAVFRSAEERGNSGMGATAVVAVFRDGAAWTAEVGDSPMYVLRNGSLTRLTRDQTQAQLLVDRGLLAPEAALRSKAKNVLLQACGTVTTLVVAQQRVALCRGDRFLLSSDGLTTHVPDAEIARVLSSSSSVDDAASTLVRLALEGGGRDNVTVIVADVDGASLPASSALNVEDARETIRAFSPDEPG